MEKKLLIIGAGGHGKVAKDVALSMMVNGKNLYKEVAFLDDTMEDAVGKISDLESLYSKYDEVFVAIGNNQLRKNLCEKIEQTEIELATLIHSTAYVSPTATIEEGTIVGPRCLINSHAIVKKGCIVSIGAIIDHDAILEEFSHANTGAICCAGSILESERKTVAGEILKGY